MSLVEQSATDTLPKLLARNMKNFPRQPGMREKDRGIWQSYSWRDCYAHVHDFALGLAAVGFKRGDKLSVLGDNRPAPLLGAAGGAGARRHGRAALPGLRSPASWPSCSTTPRSRSSSPRTRSRSTRC